ncbi:hypothetical protein CDL12_14040 [Handroanthus impetiginosus]|uniref:Uncharacterized protein n=1 Tax=Handroanthus impetiginosus TaxID=429701 RepID=A0A2G9H744_9LAMI|nr:hypothetical protein CDL12_14040 [Handroanthus impetiginosus]
MAATLSLLKLPNLPPKQPQSHPKLLPISLKTSKSQKHPCRDSFDPQRLLSEAVLHLKSAPLPLTALTLPFFLDSEDALAVGGELGILEGRSFALIHPIVMSGLFIYTLYAGYLGLQWRRVRTIQEEINELKKQVKPVAVTPDGNPPAEPPTLSPVEAKIQQLTEERKELIKGSYRDKHYNTGSILLGFGVFEAVYGGLNTWFRTGKLFPGPHLFAGTAITVLWAAAAALVPQMQKGSETARNLHVALNTLNVILFIWQIPTGIDIVFRVFESTNWP